MQRATALILLLALALGLLRGDAASAAAGPQWRLATANPDASRAVLAELGSFSSQLQVVRQAVDDYLLIDPAGTIVTRFTHDTDPRRIAARIRILLTGRFDLEIAETCTSETPVGEVRDRWQKGL